jgi:hypothetical protein
MAAVIGEGSSICAEKQLLRRETMPRHEQSTRDINTDEPLPQLRIYQPHDFGYVESRPERRF